MTTHFEAWQWTLAILAALLVGVSKTGIAGLGMLFVALFANLFPSTKQASGIVLPLLIVGDVIAVRLYKQHAQWKFLWKLFPWTALGVVFGWFALGRISDHQAKVAVGTIILSLVALHLWRKYARGAESAVAEHGIWFAPVIGVLAGFTTLVANAAGPLATIYFLAMRLPKMEFVGTGAVFFLILNWFKVPFMVGLGLITTESIRFNLLLAPAVIVGALVGRHLLTRINQKWFENLALILSVVAGVKLLL